MNTQIYEEACSWFVDMRARDVDAAARQRFDAWIRKSPEHLRAYLEITELWQDASQLEFGGIGQDMNALVARAIEEKGENVIPFEVAAAGVRTGDAGERNGAIAAQATDAQALNSRSMTRRVAIAASLLFFACATAFYAWYQFYRAPIYYTSVGEQRVISLEDGSSVKLNTRSRIRVHFTDQGRDIDLLQGQALFQVAKDPSRPFTVRIDDFKVRAVGTQFDVYRKESGATITVIEGHVVVGSDLPANVSSGSAVRIPAVKVEPTGSSASVSVVPGAGSSTHLSAGQQVTVAFNADEPLKPQPASVDTATAWTQQKLVFRASSLPEVAQEFNRYNKRQLVIADAELASFRISGVYSSTDPALLLTFLRGQPGIRVRETESSFVVTQQD